jgi:hypothetical protein
MRKTKPAGSDALSLSRDVTDRESARRIARRLAKERQKDEGPVLERAQELARRAEAPARLVACELVPLAFEEDPEDAMAVLGDLADDADPGVRAAAIAACARVAETHYERIAETLAAWRDAPSSNVRRAVATAAAHAAEPHRLERAPHLLRLLAPLLADADPAVGRAVGSTALGALLGAYPEATLEALVEWSTSSDAHVLRSVATAFSTAPAAPLAKRALIVLRKLALDERRPVWRAAAAATWQLGRRRPDVVRPELERWLEDETRGKVAREALRFL